MSIARYWKSHGTRVLGLATVIVGATLAAEDPIKAIISPQHALYYDLYSSIANYLVVGSGLATIKRGYTNAGVIRASKEQE